MIRIMIAQKVPMAAFFDTDGTYNDLNHIKTPKK